MTTIRGGLSRTLPVRDPVLENARRIARTLEGRETFTGFDGDGVIETENVALAAITDAETSAVGGAVTLSGATETTIATRTFTTTGGELEVSANFHLTVWHPAAGGITCRIRMYRGAVVIFDKTFTAINGDLIQGWQTPKAIETPAAGTYAYSVTAQTDVATWATAEADAGSVLVREFKR